MRAYVLEGRLARRRAVVVLLGLMAASWTPDLAAGADRGQAPPAGKHVRLLAIGNSFSRNTTTYLNDLVLASGKNQLTFGHACIGGCPLEKHVLLAEAFEKDDRDPDGRPYADKTSLRDWLQKEKWDYVTIQQASIKSFDIDTYRPWAKKLCDYVKRYAPQAEVLVHQTWAYRDDDPLFRDGDVPPEIMHQRLTQAYTTIARELGCRVIPVGDAFHAVRQLPDWRFNTELKVDPKAYAYPKLPEQGRSLHTGWTWRTRGDKHTLSNDAHHAGIAGQYLGACVWFEFLYGQSVVGNSFVPKGLPAGDARCLQEAAHRVLAERAPAAKQGAAR